ncbi:hypothetical protein ATCC90586_011977 [Pythium insidiosum]|nr:hypothetical protein ATCC90586_011977 [Pythium insidiosum]
MLYDKTPGSVLEIAFVGHKLGMSMDDYPALTGVHAVFAALHVLLGGTMVLWSLWKRRFSFGPLQELTLDSGPSSKVSARDDQRPDSVAPSTSSTRQQQQQQHSLRRIVCWSLSLFSRQGFFGVEGAHFDEILAVREIVESVLQAYQAYRMSQFLVRPWLNRFYVGMLVVNCWMTALVHLVFHRNELLRRVLSLLCDAVLDFTAAMVVPAVVLFSYYGDFDPEIWGFPAASWYDDVWVVKILSEFQIMLVMSWGDLASRCVFSIGLISCIESAKELIREKPSLSQPSTSGPPVPAEPEKPVPAPHRPPERARLWASFRHARYKSLRRFLQALQALCAVLGVVVIVLHVYAESAPRLEQCLIQVNPWLERKPACVLLEWDCHISHESGDSVAVATQWAKSSPTFVQRIMILHCSVFEMPVLLTTFHELTGMKIYNTTIADWGADAALTATHHPEMVLVYLVRVNMSTTGELPAGLVTAPFPPKLVDIELAISNLHTLPDHLDTLWPPHMFFFCDHCQFATLPPVLSRMSPYWVTFAVNPFSAFPFEVFQIAGLEHFQLGGVSLPLTPPTSDESFLQDTTVRYLYLPGTNLTWLPRWVDSFASLPRSLWFQPALDLTATPLCDAIGEMQAGRLDRFPAEWTANVAADQVSRYMYVERSNVSALASVVACNGMRKFAYGIEDDDARYSLREGLGT